MLFQKKSVIYLLIDITIIKGSEKMQKYILSENEESILNTLWRENRPLTRAEILELTENRDWKENSIHGILNTLLEKEAIAVADIVKTGKTFGRTYIYNITEKDYDLMQLELSMERISAPKSTFMSFFSNLVKSDKLSEKDLKELEDILKNRK